MVRLRIPLSSPVLCLTLVLVVGCAPKKPDDSVEPVPPDLSASRPSPAPDGGSGEPDVEEVVPSRWDDDVVPSERLPAASAVELAERYMEENVLSDIFFGFDRHDLSEEARAQLAGHARWLRAHPEFGVLIEGHCDERDTEEYNLALGDRRANAARDYLILLGVEPTRLQTISYGEERPVDRGTGEAAWSKNRRGHFVIQVIEGTVVGQGG